MTTRGAFSQVVDAAVRALYDQGKYDLSTTLYGPNLGCTQYEPDVPSEQISSISGPGYGVLTLEGQQYGSNELTRGYPVTLVMSKYTSELKWTEEDLHWLNKAPSSKRAITFNSVVKHAINALNGNLNLEACKIFYLGFGTTNKTGGDAVALFSGSHPIRATGSTQSNMYASGDTQRAFLAANLVDAVNIMNRFQDMNGVQMLPVKRIRVLCSVESQPTVEQAINSLYGPINANLGLQTASKEAFSARGVDISSVVLYDMPYAYRAYWFVMDLDRASEMFWLANGWMPRMNDVTDYEKGVYKNEASTFFGYVFNGWQWVFGSTGSGAAI
jgi:hypothetical protein